MAITLIFQQQIQQNCLIENWIQLIKKIVRNDDDEKNNVHHHYKDDHQ